MNTVSLALQAFATNVADVLRTSCDIDGCVKMPLQASIFTYGIILTSKERIVIL